MVSALYVTSLDPSSPGGIQTMINNQIKGLRELGHDVKIVHADPATPRRVRDFLPKRRYFRTQDNFPPTEWLRYAYYNKQERLTRNAIEKYHPDIVHAGMIRCLPALKVAEEYGLPSVVSMYAYELRNSRLAQSALNSASIAQCCSQYSKGLVEHANPSVETRTIYPSVNFSVFSESSGSEQYQGDVVSIGRLVKRKNMSTVIDAWKSLPYDIRGERVLHIIGEGPEGDSLKQRVSEEDPIRFTGFVSEQEKRQALTASDLFILVPTKKRFDIEGFGIVWVEAQAAGTPVIGSTYGGAPEAIGDCGTIVHQPSDVAEVRKVIKSNLRSSSATEEKLRNHAKKFDIPRIAGQLEEMYTNLLN